MDNNHSTGTEMSNGLTITTGLLYMLSTLTMSDVATVMALLAAATTVIYNIIKIRNETKK